MYKRKCLFLFFFFCPEYKTTDPVRVCFNEWKLLSFVVNYFLTEADRRAHTSRDVFSVKRICFGYSRSYKFNYRTALKGQNCQFVRHVKIISAGQSVYSASACRRPHFATFKCCWSWCSWPVIRSGQYYVSFGNSRADSAELVIIIVKRNVS